MIYKMDRLQHADQTENTFFKKKEESDFFIKVIKLVQT